MGLEHILKKIGEEADRELTEFNSRIEKEVSAIMADGEKKIAGLRESLLRKAKGTIGERRRSELAKARLDFRMKLLEEKQSFLEETFHSAFEHIRNMDDRDYKELVKKLAVEIAEPGEGTIVVARKDEKRIDPSLASDINKALHEMGTPAKYKVSIEDIDIDGGFILKVGAVEIDCSFSSFFKQKREELESEVSAILLRSLKKK